LNDVRAIGGFIIIIIIIIINSNAAAAAAHTVHEVNLVIISVK